MPGGQYQADQDGIKQMLVPGMLFEDMGITYLGPVDGHDIPQLVRDLKGSKEDRPCGPGPCNDEKGKGLCAGREKSCLSFTA